MSLQVAIRRAFELGCAIVAESVSDAALAAGHPDLVPRVAGGPVQAARIELLFEGIGTRLPAYRVALFAVKSLTTLWRSFEHPLYAGRLLWPRKRRRWMIRLPNIVLKSWRGSAESWCEWLDKGAKKGRHVRRDNFAHVHGECVIILCDCCHLMGVRLGGIMTDGYGLLVWGERDESKRQRTVARTTAEVVKNPDEVRAKLDGKAVNYGASGDAPEDPKAYLREEARPSSYKARRRAHPDKVPRDIGFTGQVRASTLCNQNVMGAGFFTGRVVASLDPGRRFLLAGGILLDWRLLTSVRLSSRHWYAGDGSDRAEREGRKRWASGHVGHDVDMDAWEKEQRRSSTVHSRPAFAANNRAEVRQSVRGEQARGARRRVDRHQRQRALMAQLRDTLDALFATYAITDKAPVILVGDGGGKKSWSGVHGSRGGGAQKIVDFLAEYFLVILVQEHHTSRLCPMCHEEADFANDYEWRSKTCSHCRSHKKPWRPFFYDRDIGASVNFYFIAVFMSLTGGRRPPAFRRRK
jgi:hypothetical protein